MTLLKKIGVGILVLVLLFILFALWYRNTYTMEIAQPFEVNQPSAPYHVLIATQGSTYKDSLVKEIIHRLETNLYISRSWM